jgi:hypothetical protein
VFQPDFSKKLAFLIKKYALKGSRIPNGDFVLPRNPQVKRIPDLARPLPHLSERFGKLACGIKLENHRQTLRRSLKKVSIPLEDYIKLRHIAKAPGRDFLPFRVDDQLLLNLEPRRFPFYLIGFEMIDYDFDAVFERLFQPLGIAPAGVAKQ